jgi:hypothetical protein
MSHRQRIQASGRLRADATCSFGQVLRRGATEYCDFEERYRVAEESNSNDRRLASSIGIESDMTERRQLLPDWLPHGDAITDLAGKVLDAQ